MAAHAAIGVHQFFGTPSDQRSDVVETETQTLSAALLEHVLRMGIEADAMAIAMRTPPDDIHVFNWNELSRLRIITSLCPFPHGMEIKDPLNLYPGCR